MTEKNTKKTVREFYDRVGWQITDADLYQNAQYEDLRPVSRDYIHRCHMRINRHLAQQGQYLLDAGSGPVQYPEYLTYSQGYQCRVCMDISIVALQEARKRLGAHGLYVVGDIAHLPFKSEIFDGIVSLHTIHHVPMEEKLTAYDELHRTLKPGRKMVIVNGWTDAPLMEGLSRFMTIIKRLRGWWTRRNKGNYQKSALAVEKGAHQEPLREDSSPKGTFVQKLNAEWLAHALHDKMDFEIYVWRSVSVSFLRAVIYPDWGGRFWLKVLYWFEERFPRLLGRIGQYPLVVISKPDKAVVNTGCASDV